jgi:hypothetical protein
MSTSRYETKDTPEAAFLWSLDGVDLVELVPSQRTTNNVEVSFVLNMPMDAAEVESLLLKYRNRKCSVEPIHYMNTLNNLRGMLRDCLKRASVGGR